MNPSSFPEGQRIETIDEPDVSAYRPVLSHALSHALAYLGNLDRTPVSATATLSELRMRLAKPLTDSGVEATQVIDELVADVAGGLLGSAGGRFFGWVIGGSVPAALAADWLTSTWDQNAALYACSPAEAVIEEICGRWLKELMGLPETASFALVTGCQAAHITCLAAARNAILAKHGWDVERNGLNGAPEVRILTSGERHGSVERAARLLGLGSACIVDLPADDQGCLRGDVLDRALRARADAPTIVLLRSQVNQGLVRFLDPRPGATEVDHDRRTDAVIREILQSGEAFFSGTTWRGKRCMRVSVCNWQTGDADVERAAAAVQRAIEGFH